MKTGELILLSNEEYSDYSFEGPFKVLKDFDIHAIASTVAVASPSESWRHKSGPDDVIKYLKDGGFIEEVPCKEFHLGSYGDIDVTEVNRG